jgi:hypothetical protein
MPGTMAMQSIDVLLFYDECIDHVMSVLAPKKFLVCCFVAIRVPR